MSWISFDLCTHNINGDGHPTPQWQSNRRILAIQESWKYGLPSRIRFRRWVPDLGPEGPASNNLALCFSRGDGFWREGVGRRDPIMRRMHGSGQHEGWKGVATPARYVIARDVMVGGQVVRVATTHLINSPFPPPSKADRWTALRRAIWIELEWPVIVDLVKETQQKGRLLVLAGDFNRRDCPAPPGMRRVTDPGGLDHIFVTADSARLHCDGVTPGPKTGFSGRVHHGSKTAHLAVRTLIR